MYLFIQDITSLKFSLLGISIGLGLIVVYVKLNNLQVWNRRQSELDAKMLTYKIKCASYLDYEMATDKNDEKRMRLVDEANLIESEIASHLKGHPFFGWFFKILLMVNHEK